MGNIKIKDRDIVVPGEILAEGMDYLPSYGTYRQGENIHARKLGLANIDGKVIKLIPLSGRYLPKRGDTIIGKVEEILFSGWRVDTNSAYSAMLSISDATSSYIKRGADLTKFFNIGDWIITKITNVTSQNLIDLTMKGPGLKKLHGGRIIKVNCNKVPRIIGKSGSMVSMIKKATNTRILVGQNGIVWIDGAPEEERLVVETIQKIVKESHLSGLTDRIKSFLEEKTGKKVELPERADNRGEKNDI